MKPGRKKLIYCPDCRGKMRLRSALFVADSAVECEDCGKCYLTFPLKFDFERTEYGDIRMAPKQEV